MSKLRVFLGEHNMGITTLSKLIHVSRECVIRYEKEPDKCRQKTRVKIEVALKMIREENWVRPIIAKSDLVNIEDNFCLRENHLRDVLRFEREFRQRYAELINE